MKCTVPLYPVAVFPFASFAVIVTEPAVPAVTGSGNPDTTKLAAFPGLTVKVPLVPVLPPPVVVIEMPVPDCVRVTVLV